MTREEAKDYIREWCPYARQEEIIKALEQEPCGKDINVPATNAISRQAVLDGIAIIAKAKAKSDAQKSLMGRVLFFTEHLPPVTLQPKTDTLDKIIAEIQNLRNYTCDYSDDVIDDVEDIINKYKAESEGKE